MKTVQKFSKTYLENCKKLKPEEILDFIETFKRLAFDPTSSQSKLISIKIPKDLLELFKTKANLSNHHILITIDIFKTTTNQM